MYGLYNNCPTKKHTNLHFVKQAFTTKNLVVNSEDNFIIIINIKRHRFNQWSTLIWTYYVTWKFVFPTQTWWVRQKIGHRLRIHSSAISLKSNGSHKEYHATWNKLPRVHSPSPLYPTDGVSLYSTIFYHIIIRTMEPMVHML